MASKTYIEYLEERANKVYGDVKKWVLDNIDMFSMMDLKLHNACYYAFDEMKNDFPFCNENNMFHFYEFCEQSYDTFIEYLSEEGIDFNKTIHRVGMTSKFYLTEIEDSYADNIMLDLMDYFFNDEDIIYLNILNGHITYNKEYGDDSVNDLEYFVEYFMEFVDGFLNDAYKIYNYIKDFKENQIEYFKDWLVFHEDIYEEEDKLRKEEIENRKEKCIDIMEKYNISLGDMDILKENILYF